MSDLIEQLKRASKGNGETLTQLLSQYRGRLKLMVSLRLDRRLQGRIDPSDVIQEAFLEATERLQDYVNDPPMPFFLWLRFITVQKLLVIHRQNLGAQRRDARREVSIYRGEVPDATSEALVARLIGHQSTPSQAAQRAERSMQLQAALDAMPPFDREVLVLRHFEELSNSETAEVLEISVTAANNRYVRALERFKDTLMSMPGGIKEMP